MALQENNSSEKNNSRGVTKKFWHFTIASLRYLFDNFNTLPFIGALVVTYKYVEIAVVSILMDYFNDSMEVESQRIAAIVTNLQDGLSSLFVVIVYQISAAYTGYYTMITFCTAASIEGLMLLWTSASSTKPSTFRAVYGAIFFLALGTSGKKLLQSFYEYQSEEKTKDRHARSGSTENKKEQTFADKALINGWLYTPLVGYVVIMFLSFIKISMTYEERFLFAALLMGGTYMLFLAGSVWYSREELPIESNLHKIYRIFKVALGKRYEKYPTSPSGYYWKDSKRGRSYEYHEGVRLLPPVPCLLRWLDKAAILEAEDSRESLELQEKNEKLCTVKEVSDVKSLVPMFCLCLAFFGYSLLLATENTFFISQASNMRSNITTSHNDISFLVLITVITRDATRTICHIISCAIGHFKIFSCIDNVCNKKAAIARIGLGMVCAIICSLIAWQVEVGRLKVSTYEDRRNSTVALLPQFSALGITKGLIEGGIENLFHGHVAKSMWSFDDAYKELVIGSGKLMIIPLVLSIPSWFGDTLDSSRLDKFYLTLGILNAVFLLVFCFYSLKYAYKEVRPEDDPAIED
ncbi:uncharacterized protein HKW66_Vig0202140 [Vigna angularis]|uniref:Uncharacterized protein n=2 Tax=Phaseolus angularis TaxID=3914 RepID=A0A8T0JSR9_PHAAN|nr:uncharacterized protein HKW66_Vig0202140 [Vigna angularis]